MPILIVVNQPDDWPLSLPGVELVSARDYLTLPQYSDMRGVRVFNFCRSYRYQSAGYYVSLLAVARGHRPLPDITAIQDMKSTTIVRIASDELDELIQKSLAPIASDRFTLSIYFGRNLAKRYDRLCQHLFKLFEAPLLRAQFSRNGKWALQTIHPIAFSEIPPEHHAFLVEVAIEHFAGRRAGVPKRAAPRYDLAILTNADDPNPPSDAKALQKFERAAEPLGLRTEFIDKEDYGRVAEFDALFIRETTSVNHHTYRFARRAQAEGLVVVDDPESILKCSNKVYLAELLDHHELSRPRTLIVHRDNVEAVPRELGFPLVLKQPDSTFSQGIVKIESEAAFAEQAEKLLERSDLVIAQQFISTTFDWRVGVFDRQPLYVCKYYMARSHWQIVKRGAAGENSFGRIETLPVGLAPSRLVKLAVKAANLVGDGLYGVDIKQSGREFYVIEVNDNPNIDAGCEDAVLKDDLYTRIMSVLLRRLESLKSP